MEVVGPEVDADAEEIDILKFTFDELELEYNAINKGDINAFVVLLPRYQSILNDVRTDDDAIKIREAAFYKITR